MIKINTRRGLNITSLLYNCIIYIHFEAVKTETALINILCIQGNLQCSKTSYTSYVKYGDENPGVRINKKNTSPC